MTVLTALWLSLAAWSKAPAFPARLEAALVHAESRGVPWVKNGPCMGLWQVNYRFASPLVRRYPALLYLPPIGQAEGRLALAYWRRQCRGRMRCALAAYTCGWSGVRGTCGGGYADGILARK